jgi:cobalt/nickel transport system permease protein
MDAIEFYDPNNRWRDRHPAEKAALAGGMLLLAVALPPGVVTALIAVFMAAAALIGARVSWRRFLGGLAVPAGFLLVGTLTVLVSFSWQPGHALPTLTLDGPAAVRVFLRGLAATTCLIFFATTTSLPDLLALLRAARCPDFIVELMMLTYRFALALVQTARALRLAQRLRLGYGSRAARYRSLALLATTLLPRSLDRAKRLARGLETRGYDGQLPVLSATRQLSWAMVGAAFGVQLALAGLAVVEARGGV